MAMTNNEFIADFRNRIKSFEEFDDFAVQLMKRIINDEPITDNGMNDGFVIGLMVARASTVYNAMTDNLNEYAVSENTARLVKVVLSWLCDNWQLLIELE